VHRRCSNTALAAGDVCLTSKSSTRRRCKASVWVAAVVTTSHRSSLRCSSRRPVGGVLLYLHICGAVWRPVWCAASSASLKSNNWLFLDELGVLFLLKCVCIRHTVLLVRIRLVHTSRCAYPCFCRIIGTRNLGDLRPLLAIVWLGYNQFSLKIMSW